METVYVAFLNVDCNSKVLGVFRNKTDAMTLCKNEAELLANDLYPPDYEYEKLYCDEDGISVDVFDFQVVKMSIQ